MEKLARGSGKSELDVAQQGQKLAAASGTKAVAGFGGLHEVKPEQHIGYFLLERGRGQLETMIGYRPGLKDRWHHLLLDRPQTVYLGGIALLTLAFVAGIVLGIAALHGMQSWALALLGLAALVPASELAIGVIHSLITHTLPPRVLPKLLFKEGVPASCATFVVIPCLLLRRDSVALLLQRLEIHYLSNPDPHLWFALLTDFADAPSEHMPEDDDYLAEALAGVQALNHAPRQQR